MKIENTSAKRLHRRNRFPRSNFMTCSYLIIVIILTMVCKLPADDSIGEVPTAANEPESYTHRGKPFFPIILYGSYHSSGDTDGDGISDGAVDILTRDSGTGKYTHLEEIATSGFNVLRDGAWRNAKQGMDLTQLNACFSHGFSILQGHAPWFERFDLYKTKVDDFIDNVAGTHPGFFGWSLSDEPYLNLNCDRATEAELIAGFDYLGDKKEENHPISLIFADYAIYGNNQCAAGCVVDVNDSDGDGDFTDLVRDEETCAVSGAQDWVNRSTAYSMDIYPVVNSNYPANGLQRIQEGFTYLRKDIVETIQSGDCETIYPPQGMVLQSCTWNQMRRSGTFPQPGYDVYPSVEEHRYMAFSSIIHGAKSLEWYGVERILTDWPSEWDKIKTVTCIFR